MARIFLSYASADLDFAAQLADRLKQSGNEITVDVDSISAGQNWRVRLSEGLRNAEVFVVLISQSSVRSASVLQELGAARAYADESDRMLVIPILIDDISIPSVVQDILVLRAPERDLDEILGKINVAISTFIGRRAATEEKAAEVVKRIETNAATYIDDAILAQQNSEAQNRRYGNYWYIVGFCALVLGLGFAVFGAGTHSLGSNWPDFGVIALKSILVIGLLGASSKYAFSLGKSYISEALKCSDRIHAIGFGKFYLKAYGEKATWSELKEVFQHWNIDRSSTFSTLDPAQIDPQIIGLISKVANTTVERVLGRKP